MKNFSKFEVPEFKREFKGEVDDYKDPKYFDNIFTPNKLVELPVSERVKWGVNRKTGQHSRYYDLMVIQYGPEAIPTLGELTEEEGKSLLELSADVAEEIHNKPDTEMTLIDWNSSSKEFGRKNPQSVKRIHFHTTGITKEEFDESFDEVNFSDLSDNDRRKTRKELRDPFIGIFCETMQEEIINDLKGTDDIFVLDSQKSRTGDFPMGFEIDLKDGLETLKKEEFFSVIQEIHIRLEKKYEDFSNIFTSGEFDENDRPKLLPKGEIDKRIEKFGEDNDHLKYTKKFFNKFAGIAKDAEQVPDSEWLMKGLGYSAAIYCDKRKGDKWRLVMSPRVVSETGALEIFGIKLIRTEGRQFTEEELEKQNDFRKELSEKLIEEYQGKIKKGPLGIKLEENS